MCNRNVALGRVEGVWIKCLLWRSVTQVCEKYLVKVKDVFWTFTDLDTPYERYDTIDQHNM